MYLKSWIRWVVSTGDPRLCFLFSCVLRSSWPWRWPLRPCASASPSCRCARLSLTLTGSRSRTALIPAADSSTAWPSRCTLIRITQTQVRSYSSGYDWEHLQTVWDQDEFVSICLCSSGWVPPERESDINITITHSPSVNVWRRNISIKSIIHNNSSSSDKVLWGESGEKSAQIKQRLQDKHVAKTKTDALFHWRKSYYGLVFELKTS